MKWPPIKYIRKTTIDEANRNMLHRRDTDFALSVIDIGESGYVDGCATFYIFPIFKVLPIDSLLQSDS